MTVKDFEKGQKAFKFIENRGRNKPFEIIEVEIVAVGRKYVTINGRGERYCVYDSPRIPRTALREDTGWGDCSLLFKTREDAENYKEKLVTILWLRQNADRHWDKMTLPQLKKVKMILEHGPFTGKLPEEHDGE